MQRLDAGDARHVEVEQHDVRPLRERPCGCPRSRRPPRRRPRSPARRASSAVMPRRNSVWSSTTTMRMGVAHGVSGASSRHAASRCATGRVSTTSVPAPGASGRRASRRCACARSRMMRRPTWSAVIRRSRLADRSRGRRRGPRTRARARAASRPRRPWRRACLRTLDSASCRMCITCSCTSGASGTAAPRRLQLGPARRSGARSASAACARRARRRLRRVRVRKWTSSSRTSA